MELCSLRDEQWHSIDAPLLAPPRVVFVPAGCRPLLLFGWIRVVAVVGRGHRAVRVQPAQDGVGDAGQLVDLPGVQAANTCGRTLGTGPGGNSRTFVQPAAVRRALVARASSGQGNRSTRPRSSSRRTTWDSRGR